MARAVLWQRIEGLVLFAVGLALFWRYDTTMPWWAGLLVFFVPDISFLGYLLGPRIGAFVYNSVHIYAFGAVILALGLLLPAPLLVLLGVLWLAHSGFDRMLGYGLKTPEGFSFTHLGQIGKRA